MEIFINHIDSQYVDSIGKTRVVFIGSVAIILPIPIRPLNLPLKTLDDITPLKTNTILDFVKKFDLKISEVINCNPRYYVKISGDFLLPIIPINNFKVGNENIEITIKSDPLFTSEKSELLEYRYQKKIAEYLKLYTLYYYINLGEPEFEIIEDHSYDIKVLKDTIYLPGEEADGIIYSGDKIIVLSQKSADNLKSYLDTQKANGFRTLDRSKIEEVTFSNKIDYFTDIYDYRHSNKFTVFDSTASLIKWFIANEKKDKNTATQNFKFDALEPFFFYNKKIHDNPVLIQPVETLDIGLSVISYWIDNKINIGYNPNLDNFTIKNLKNYNILNMNVEGSDVKNITVKGKKNKNFIIENNGKYYAVLII